ncbi:methyltransferase domain-containing protein [Staphylococcus hominis]|uniref:methyltransferase domain-containing protein n=1 Tax=Staphylococcus hominis TaxID=1290 RepID=UPI000E6A3ECE|nr:methyltransferase domain-containing protein [Staphylococcus hominis]RIO55019.1 methyltransferase domain-containing protein [Staphylococcus hominis]
MRSNNYENNFALFYNEKLTELSSKMSDFYISYFSNHKMPNKKILDIICGPGVLINKFHKNGWNPYALDKSNTMVEIAKKNNTALEDNIYKVDISEMNDDNEFSLVTCTADGFNHIKSLDILESIFIKVNNSLLDGGYFAFDINTVLGIVNNDYYVSTNDNNTLIIRNGLTDIENNVGYTKFKGFFKYKGEYLKFETVIHNYMYTVESIKEILKNAGFDNIKIFDASDSSNIHSNISNSENCERVVIISQKNKR